MVHSEVLRWVGLLCGVMFLACYGAAYWLGLPLDTTPHALRPLVHKLVLIGTVNLAVLLCVLMFAKRRTDHP